MIVRWPNLLELGQLIGVAKRFESVLPDVRYFRYQSRALKQTSLSQYAAWFKNGGPDGDFVPVLVQVPDLHNLHTSYESALNQLRHSELRLEKVAPEESEDVFVDRLAEFLAVRFASDGSSSAQTIVNSNRRGDTVLYANGYFLSTATAFGVSTPATGSLSGKYSFGIMDSGRHRFENIVWNCPTTVRLNLP